jgi:hypothetical protein
MTAEQKLSVLIPLKVTQTMANELAVMAGGTRKRAEYIRGLIEKDIKAALDMTEEGIFCAKLVIEMRENPELFAEARALLRNATRKRMRKNA